MTITERRKKYGQVFTPSPVAALMADWVMSARPSRVLDPAFGRGALAIACLHLNPDVRIVGYEIDPIVLHEVSDQVGSKCAVVLDDFLGAPINDLFEGIIANPPYLRHRELKGHMSQRKHLSQISGCEIPKSANLYIDFLVKATLHLSPGGRSAFLIPAEWMSANFSAGLKRYLLDNNLIRSLVTFSNCSNVFSDALTTASLVLMEKGAEPIEEITSYYLQSIDGTNAPQSLAELNHICEPRTVSTADLRLAAKWEPLLRGDRSTLPPGWTPLGELVVTRRGIATGANEFFLIDSNRRIEAKIDHAHVLPCVGRSNDVKGLVFSNADFQTLDAQQANVWLLNFAPILSAAERDYIHEGESKGLHKRFLTKCRQPWFGMEQREPAPIWAGVFGRGDLRFIYNEARVRSLTNFHCVYPKFGGTVFAQALVVALNSRPVRELMVSHRRGYGGGLLKFEPKDLLTVPVPDLRNFDAQTIAELARELEPMHARQQNGLEPSTDRANEIVTTARATEPSDTFRLVG